MCYTDGILSSQYGKCVVWTEYSHPSMANVSYRQNNLVPVWQLCCIDGILSSQYDKCVVQTEYSHLSMANVLYERNTLIPVFLIGFHKST